MSSVRPSASSGRSTHEGAGAESPVSPRPGHWLQRGHPGNLGGGDSELDVFREQDEPGCRDCRLIASVCVCVFFFLTFFGHAPQCSGACSCSARGESLVAGLGGGRLSCWPSTPGWPRARPAPPAIAPALLPRSGGRDAGLPPRVSVLARCWSAFPCLHFGRGRATVRTEGTRGPARWGWAEVAAGCRQRLELLGRPGHGDCVGTELAQGRPGNWVCLPDRGGSCCSLPSKEKLLAYRSVS